jgi:hypothetical protein
VCFISSLKETGWIIDNGCIYHITGDKLNFNTLKPYNGGMITFGVTKEKATLLGPVGNQNFIIINVYFVNGLNYNLLNLDINYI